MSERLVLTAINDPAVQAVLTSREWPAGNTADSCAMYAEMMRLSCDLSDDGKDGRVTYDPAKGVNFTNKGDRAIAPRSSTTSSR